jgi:hypothetical protein
MPDLSKLCVVIPCGPGETSWQALLPQLAGLPGSAEIVLSGVSGSAHWPPRSADLLADPLTGRGSCRLAEGPAGRAAQQNRGAAAGRNPWLWFLHADSRLHADALSHVAAMPESPTLGYFDLAFHDGPASMQLNRLGAFVRSRWLGMPFGDQGLLLPRAAFDSLGGFDESLSGGEDHALVWSARRAGLQLRPLRLPLYTSARKYIEHGWWQTTARHLQLSWQQARRFSRGRP